MSDKAGAGWTRDDVLTEVRRVAQLVGKQVLTKKEFCRHSRVGYGIVRRLFGNWRTTLSFAGLGYLCYGASKEARHILHTKLSTRDLLAEVRRVAQLAGKSELSKATFSQLSDIYPETLCKRFGSWRHALRRAGIEHMSTFAADATWEKARPVYSDEGLLKELRRVADAIRRPVLTRKDFEAASKINPATVFARFGSWQKALERAGLGHLYFDQDSGGRRTRLTHIKYSDKELLDEVRRVAAEIDKPTLSARAFRERSRIPINTVVNRFGKWLDILRKAGLEHMFSGPQKGGRKKIRKGADQDSPLVTGH